MPTGKVPDLACTWAPLHAALQQHVRIPLLRDHSEDWNKTAPESLGRSFANNGQISATDNKDVVLWYTLSYSCMHFDALNDLMNTDEFKQTIIFDDSTKPSVLHVDFGCGPGTATWAVVKNLPDTFQVKTIGHDHNPHMANLAKAMVRTISHVMFDFSSDWKTFQHQVLGNAKQKALFLVTANSLFGQRTFHRSHLEDTINLIKNLRTESPQAVTVICGTHPQYRPESVVSTWQRIVAGIGADTVDVHDRKIESWSPLQCTRDIRDSWYPWTPDPQLAQILVLPPTGGKR